MVMELPPGLHTADGRLRRVGFELEFTGLEIERVVEIVVEHFGGTVREQNRFEFVIDDTEHGRFRVEVDASILHEQRYREWIEGLGLRLRPEQWGSVETALMDVASIAVPFEVVTPPFPIDSLDPIVELSESLRDAKAVGTTASPLYAFGLQFNPEAPGLGPETITAFLRAFLLLYEWLEHEANVDLSRRIAPYINRFPEAYARRVIDPEYSPELDRLIDDYIAYNPTRSRPLDLLPLFAHLDERRVLDAVKEPHLVKPRPTFHYRLPDCRLDEPGWSPADEWNRWVVVERLAGDAGRMAALASMWSDSHRTASERVRNALSDWFGG